MYVAFARFITSIKLMIEREICKIRRFKISNYSGILQYIKSVYFNICYSDSSPGNASPLLWNFYLLLYLNMPKDCKY